MVVVKRIPKGTPLSFEEMDGNWDTLSLTVASVQTDVTVLTGQTNSLEGNIAAMATTVGQHTTSINTLSPIVEQHSSNITTLSSDLISTTDRVTTLEGAGTQPHEVTHLPAGSDAFPWNNIHGIGTTANRPIADASNLGYIYFDNELKLLQRSNGISWDDIGSSNVGKFSAALTPTSALLFGLSSEPYAQTINGTNLNYDELGFNDTIVNSTQWMIPAQLTQGYSGSPIIFTLRWYAAAITGGVRWQIQMLSKSSGTTIDSTPFPTARDFVLVGPPGTTNQLVISTLSFTPTSTELTANQPLWIKLSRLATDSNDTMVGDAKVIDFSIKEN
jgi:hypothetical protein